MTSPYKIRQLLERIKNDHNLEDINQLATILEKDFPQPLLSHQTAKNCTKCSFRMHNRRTKCPNCFQPVEPHTPYQLKRKRPEKKENDCHICAQPFDDLIRLECGCHFCNGCLKERLGTKKYCAVHKKVFKDEIIDGYG